MQTRKRASEYNVSTCSGLTSFRKPRKEQHPLFHNDRIDFDEIIRDARRKVKSMETFPRPLLPTTASVALLMINNNDCVERALGCVSEDRDSGVLPATLLANATSWFGLVFAL